MVESAFVNVGASGFADAVPGEALVADALPRSWHVDAGRVGAAFAMIDLALVYVGATGRSDASSLIAGISDVVTISEETISFFVAKSCALNLTN